MKYSIKVNEVRAKDGSNIKGFATVVFGDSFKITNIAILENKEKGELFVSMPRYRSNERDEKNSVIYKDVCNPIIIVIAVSTIYSNSLSVAISKSIEKPLNELKDRFITFAEGDIDSPLPTVESEDEIKELVSGVSAMSDRIRVIIKDYI